jgi:hypothetical protein
VHYPAAGFFFLPARAWEIGVGALVAVVLHRRSVDLERIASGWWTAVGLALVLGSCVLMSGGGGSFPGQLLLPVLGCVLVVVFGRSDAAVPSRVLSHPATVYIGRISYSLYLWHWPVIVLGRVARDWLGSSLPDAFLLLPMTVLGVASYHLVEVPTRHDRRTPWVVGVALLACLALAFHFHRQPLSTPPTFVRDGVPVLPGAPGGVTILKRTNGDSGRTVVLYGDSHASMWSVTMDEVARETGVDILHLFKVPLVVEEVSPGHPDHAAQQQLLGLLAEEKPRVIVFSARWTVQDLGRIGRTLERLGELGDHLLIMAPQPELAFVDADAGEVVGALLPEGHDPAAPFSLPMSNRGKYTAARDWLRAYVADRPNVHLVEVEDLFVDEDGRVRALDGRTMLYFDNDHVTNDGGRVLKPRVKELLGRLLEPGA